MYLSEHIIIHAYKKIHSTQTNTQMLAYTAMTELTDGILDGARLLADSLNDSMGVPCCRDENITQWTVSQSLHNGQSVQSTTSCPISHSKTAVSLTLCCFISCCTARARHQNAFRDLHSYSNSNTPSHSVVSRVHKNRRLK